MRSTIRSNNNIVSFFAVMLAAVMLVSAALLSCAKANDEYTAAEMKNLGEESLSAHENVPAAKFFGMVIDLEPDKTRGYLGLSEVFLALGDEARAIATLERGLQAIPGDANMTMMLDRLTAPHEQTPAVGTESAN